MTQDNISNLGAAESAAFSDDPLRFDSLFNDDDEAPVTRFTSINDPGDSMSSLPETVSPADLLYNDFSAPNSNTFTHLTTPSMLDDTSPFLTDSTNVSPAYRLGDFGSVDADHEMLDPLFPSNDFDHLGSGTTGGVSRSDRDISSSTESLARHVSDMAMSRSVSTSTKADVTRHRRSTTAGITKSSRRATKPLAPIEVDENDEQALKRAKNTMAARKSRQKKKDEVETLQTELDEMTEERDYWRLVAVQLGADIPKGN